MRCPGCKEPPKPAMQTQYTTTMIFLGPPLRIPSAWLRTGALALPRSFIEEK